MDCEISAETFWALTPCELWDELDASEVRQQELRDQQITQAWHTVRIWIRSHQTRGHAQVLQVPDLKVLLDEWRPKQPQSPAQMLATLTGAGLKARKKKKKRKPK